MFNEDTNNMCLQLRRDLGEDHPYVLALLGPTYLYDDEMQDAIRAVEGAESVEAVGRYEERVYNERRMFHADFPDGSSKYIAIHRRKENYEAPFASYYVSVNEGIPKVERDMKPVFRKVSTVWVASWGYDDFSDVGESIIEICATKEAAIKAAQADRLKSMVWRDYVPEITVSDDEELRPSDGHYAVYPRPVYE